MTTDQDTLEESDDLEETTEKTEEKLKPTISSSIKPKFGASFPSQHNFRGGQNTMNNNRQRPGRAANRGR